MHTITLEVVDPVLTRIKSKKGARLIKPCLQYPAVFWRDGAFGKEKVDYKKNVLLELEDGMFFWTGLLPRVVTYCKKNNYSVEVLDHEYKGQFKKPKIKGITLRPDQTENIQAALDAGRGLILAPTGTGKTILQLGIISAMPDYNVLLLAHTKGIVIQTCEKMEKYGFKSVKMLHGGTDKDIKGYRVVVSTMQTFNKLPLSETAEQFDAVIIDEGHHISTPTGTYAQILMALNAPFRWAFTATENNKHEAKMTCEGLIGPVIKEMSINKAVKLGILAKPKVILRRGPFSVSAANEKRYPDVYNAGIVHNDARNKMIMDIARENIASRKSVLILITRIEHGNELMRQSKGIDAYFVQGVTDDEEREWIKEELISKNIKCVIATAVWKEGIDIPSLDVVINAAGGKSEIVTLQSVGRGLRKTDEKDRVLIYDFFDPSHRFFVSHFGERVTLYFDEGWI